MSRADIRLEVWQHSARRVQRTAPRWLVLDQHYCTASCTEALKVAEAVSSANSLDSKGSVFINLVAQA
jgi:hypothetical protein